MSSRVNIATYSFDEFTTSRNNGEKYFKFKKQWQPTITSIMMDPVNKLVYCFYEDDTYIKFTYALNLDFVQDEVQNITLTFAKGQGQDQKYPIEIAFHLHNDEMRKFECTDITIDSADPLNKMGNLVKPNNNEQGPMRKDEGGSIFKKSNDRVVLGKRNAVVYNKTRSKTKYVKVKNNFIKLSEAKKLMKDKNK